jgi:DNA-binding MltR family transcriptional regulator
MNKEDYAPQEIRLAYEIAEALNDRASVPLYLHFAHTYLEEDLRKLLERVLSVPDEKIKKTRGALFTYLVAYYEQKNTRD